MWTIRKEQIAALRQPLVAGFHRELLGHVRKHFVEETENRSDEEILEHIRQAAGRAALYGFTSERDVYNYINISMLLGPDFDQAKESRWTRKFLVDKNILSPSRRLDRLYEELTRRLELEERGVEG